MKIGIFIGGLSSGGAERVACNLANYLVENKENEVTIITMGNDKNAYRLCDKINRMSLSKDYNNSNFFLKNLIRLLTLKKILLTTDMDVYLGFLPISNCILLSLKRFIKAPVIICERCSPSSYNILKKKFIKTFYPMADGYIFQTKEAQCYYTGTISNESIVIPNAINEEFLHIKSNNREIEKKIVGIGRFTNQKNFKMLIEAFSRISEKHKEYKLIIYGDGELRSELEKQIQKLGLTEKIELPGYVTNIRECIENATMFILSSDYEGMPNALLEAMALGLPCVATDCPCGGPRFLINNRENGLLVKVGDSDEMTRAIDEILSDTEFAKKISNNAKKISDNLSADKIYKQWEFYLESIVKKYKG